MATYNPAGPCTAAVFVQLHKEQRSSNYADWPQVVEAFAAQLGNTRSLDADGIREISQLLDDLARAASELADRSERK